MPRFRRSRHLGRRSIKVLDQELESLLSQYSPNTLTLKELTEFKKVYFGIIDDYLKRGTTAEVERKLKDIETKFKQIDETYQLPAFTRD